MKTKIFCFFVALGFLFSACSKDSTPATVEDDVFDASIKGYAKLDPETPEGKDLWVFNWNAITASDFAKGKTPPFNNWEKPLGKGVYVYRVPAGNTSINAGVTKAVGGGATYLESLTKQQFGNGNDPVWIWFDENAFENEYIKDGTTITGVANHAGATVAGNVTVRRIFPPYQNGGKTKTVKVVKN